MSLPQTCPFCGSFAELRNGEKWVGYTCITTIRAGHDARRMQSITCAGLERTRLLARVAELEARTREAEESNANALARLSAAEATIELRRIENEAVRHQVWHAENVCDAMEKRVFDTEARCKRLEEAAREVYLDSIASDHQWSEKETRNMHALRDVLEAKP